MRIYRSARLEELVSRLSEVLRAPLSSPLESEVVLIQSAGMERYLSREIARQCGIAANFRFPFPRAFLREVLDLALGEADVAGAFEREQMTWTLFEMLGQEERGSDPVFAVVRAHLEGDEDHTRRLLLAERLANLFDQYVTYRAEMVLEWQKGKGATGQNPIEEFQAALFRRLVDRFGPVHFAARCNVFLNQLADSEIKKALPERVSLVGGPGLPPLFVRLFSRMGKVIPVHVFSFSVCREFFMDMHPVWPEVSEVEHDSHPLLFSMGQVGAHYQDLLETTAYEEGAARFEPPNVTSLLSALQHSLVIGKLKSEELSPEVLRALSGDGSITVDACHSPLREVEVLHDRLLSAFHQDPSLAPEDVVVLAPNIEAYSPLISAVFSARSGDHPAIPYRVADRSEKHTNSAARALLASLTLLRGRLKASELLDLLQLEPVRRRYGMEKVDLEKVRKWVEVAKIRWAADSAQRKRFGLPDSDDNTWAFGLRRLLLGYALFEEGNQIWRGTVPVDEVSVEDAELLGRFCDAVESLTRLTAQIGRAGPEGLTLAEWKPLLHSVCDAVLVEDPEGRWDAEAVRRAIETVFARAESLTAPSGEEFRLGTPAITHLLGTELDNQRPSTDFLSGGVTFCALLPLRTIPFRMVSVLGMNQGEFPRTDRTSQLDLMALHPRRGDRSLRADDRYLFLEVLLSARERLCMSYVGRSIQDNTEKPRSVVLTELADALSGLVGDESCLRVQAHPLQPFHPSYFDPSVVGLVSLDVRSFEGARALISDEKSMEPFFSVDQPLPPPSALDSAFAPDLRRRDKKVRAEMTWEELIGFWKDPTSAYLTRLGVRIQDEIVPVEDRELAVEDPLSRYWLGQRVLSQLESGNPLRKDVEMSRGELPVGQGGVQLLAWATEAAEAIRVSAEQERGGISQEHVPVELLFEAQDASLEEFGISSAQPDEIRLSGVIDSVFAQVRVEASFGKLTAPRMISLWIKHLALCASGRSVSSVIVTRGDHTTEEDAERWRLLPLRPEKARRTLGKLVFLARAGLSVPLPFFLEPSETYFAAVRRSAKGLDEEEIQKGAYQRARALLIPDDKPPAPTILAVYRDLDPLSPDGLFERGVSVPSLRFARLSEFVFGSMQEAAASQGAEA